MRTWLQTAAMRPVLMIFIMSRSNMPRPVILTSRFHINDAQATGESNGNVNMEEAPEEGTDMM